jgi:hypothetical protein
VLRIGRVSVAYWGLLGPAGACWGLLMPTVIPVSTWLPVSSVLSACYCLDRRCVFKSLATPSYDRRINNSVSSQFDSYEPGRLQILAIIRVRVVLLLVTTDRMEVANYL